MYVKSKSKEVQTLSSVKQVLSCNIPKTVNSLLDSGDWILIRITKTDGRNDRPLFWLGRVQ